MWIPLGTFTKYFTLDSCTFWSSHSMLLQLNAFHLRFLTFTAKVLLHFLSGQAQSLQLSQRTSQVAHETKALYLPAPNRSKICKNRKFCCPELNWDPLTLEFNRPVAWMVLLALEEGVKLRNPWNQRGNHICNVLNAKNFQTNLDDPGKREVCLSTSGSC